ncbi:MAG: MarR family winged helix-turn-helix transcriptional regulator [Archangium sp.]
MNQIGALLEEFLNHVSHPRGLALTHLAEAGVTVDQAILLSRVNESPGVALSTVAGGLGLSLPSASQMTERLVKQGYLKREESTEDRRRKSLQVTAKARKFLSAFKKVRAGEFSEGTSKLSEATQAKLVAALERALKELAP